MRRSAHPSAPAAALAAVLALVVTAPPASGQHAATTARDPYLDDLLAKAAAAVRKGDHDEAVRLYLEVEAALEKQEKERPDARPTTEVGPGIDRSVGLYLRDEVAALPLDAQRRYRLTIDPRARRALDAALESGVPEAVEAVVARYPLASVTREAQRALVGLAFERGELGRALRACRALEQGATPDEARRLAVLRIHAAAIRGDRREAEQALADFVARGGDPTRPRPFGAGEARLDELVARVGARGPAGAVADGFDPGARVRELTLAGAELPAALAERLGAPTAALEPVPSPIEGALLVADGKSVWSLALAPRAPSWSFSYPLDEGEPGRVEAAVHRPAVGPGRVFATLHRNRPAILPPAPAPAGEGAAPAGEGEGAPGGEGDEPAPEGGEQGGPPPADEPPEPAPAVRRDDWRVVALDAATGALVWDAASDEAFGALARQAEWVSSPLFFEGAVYVLVLSRPNDLEASLVRLDAASGAMRRRTFLASRPGYDYRGIGAPPAPPSASPLGDVVCATGLGVVAAVDPTLGELEWLTRYPAPPAGSEPTLVEAGRRFRATSPLAERGPIVVAPVDSAEALALDPATGRVVWRAPRGGARLCAAGPAGEVLLLGDRLLALDRLTGAVRLAGPALAHPISAPPAILGSELVAASDVGLVRLGLADGALLGTLRFTDPLREHGAAIALPLADGGVLLATIGFERVNLYETFAARRAAIAHRYGGSPHEPYLLGVLHAGRGDVASAVHHLRRAVEGGLDQTTKLKARRVGVELLAPEALRLLAAGDEAGFRRAAEHALGFLGGVGKTPEELGSRAERDLVLAAAPLLRAYADVLARSDDLEDGVRAARALQRLLWTPPGTLVALDDATEVDAAAYARVRLRELVARRGRAVYATFDQLAEETYRLAQRASGVSQLRRVAEEFPAASLAATARLELARAYAADGLRSEAAAELERFVQDYPEDGRRPDALAQLAGLYETLRRPAAARRALRALASTPAGTTIRPAGSGSALDAAGWARARLEVLADGQEPVALARAMASAGLEAPLARAFRTPTELSQLGMELLEPEGWESGPDELFFLRRGDALEVRRAGDGRRLALIGGLEPASPRLAPVVVGERLIVPWKDRVEAFSLAGPELGRRLWRSEVAAGEGARIGPDPVHGIAPGEDLVAVLTGANEVVALAAADGQPRWRRPLPLRASGGLRVRRGKVLALSREEATLTALAAADGAPVWVYRPPALPGVPARLAEPAWLDARTLLLVHGGKLAQAIDVDTGQQRWSGPSAGGGWLLELLPAPDGSSVVAKLQVPGGFALQVLDGATGAERWRDEGAGAIRAGADPPPGLRTAIERAIVGEDAVYTFRTRAGRTELWCQTLAFGQQRWTWALPLGSRAFTLIEAPTAVLVPRGGMIAAQASLSVLGRGSGEVKQTIELTGRRLVGLGAVARAGVLVLSTERGAFGLTRIDPGALARETVRLGRALAATPDDAELRAQLAALLDQQGRRGAALDLLERGMLAEGVRTGGFDALFGSMAAIAESLSEEAPPTLPIRALPRPPEIDGDLADWWRPWSAIALRGPRWVQPIQQEPTSSPGRWTGEEDLSGHLYLGWDARHLYFALDVNDTNLRPYDSEAERWVGDCLLIAIDTLGNGGQTVMGDDLLLSLALTLPRRKDEDEEQQQQEAEESKPEGKYFVRRKEDGSGAVYEAAIPWSMFAKNGAAIPPGGGPPRGFGFGMNLVLTDDDGDRLEAGEDGDSGGQRGALKALELTPSVLLHYEKSRLWRGYIPDRFARVRLE